MLLGVRLPHVLDPRCLRREFVCSLCTATDPEKTCVSLKMSWASKADEYFPVLAPFMLVSKEAVCVLLYLASF